MENQNVIYGINGPVVTVKNARSFSMMEMVFVGHERLVGEIIGINDKFTTIQVYEETTGLTPVSYTHLHVPWQRQQGTAPIPTVPGQDVPAAASAENYGIG